MGGGGGGLGEGVGACENERSVLGPLSSRILLLWIDTGLNLSETPDKGSETQSIPG